MYAAERHQRIIAMAEAHGRVEVAALAEQFDVTVETVRRDLSALEARGLIRRVHGGALPVRAQGFEPSLGDRAASAVEAKAAMARQACELIKDGVRSIVLDAGSSTTALAAELPSFLGETRELTVITNSLPIATLLSPVRTIHLHLLGGRLRQRTLAAVGESAVQQLSELCADVTFIGTNGVHPVRGLTTPNAEEAHTKRAMVAAGDVVVALADGSKLGQTHLAKIADLSAVDVLVTDAGADDELIDELAAQDLEVVRA